MDLYIEGSGVVMSKILHMITDRVTTKKGMWLTVAIWIIVVAVLTVFAPDSNDYKVSSVDALPEHMPSVTAQKQNDEYFSQNEGITALLVFQFKSYTIEFSQIINII